MATKINSFVENVNAIANASALAVGDVVEDTQAARDEAVAAAIAANDSEIASKDSEELSQAWANKGYNNPVTGTVAGSDAEFSSYHWSVEASNVIGDPIINDLQIRTDKTFSSQKITDELATKSDTTHNHTGIYEPLITKASGFNKPFGGNGLDDTVARGDHNHDANYHTKFTENSAFNKEFGTSNFDVMRGDTRFDSDYMPLATQNSAYNKSFVFDSLNPLADEIPRGNHSHTSAGISYDSTNNTVVTSSTAQGAITQLDSVLGQLDIAEASYTTLLSNAQYSQVVVSSNIATKLLMPLPAVNGDKNATNNANAEITIEYPADARPEKLVEGFYIANIVFSGTDNIGVNMALNDVIIGDAVATVGGEVSLTQFITNIDITGKAPLNTTSATLALYLTNFTSGNNIVVESCNIVWRGAPEGAIVSSGTVVDHGDLTGTGATNGVHTISDLPELVTDLSTRPIKIGTPVEDNVLIQSATGDLKESGVSISSLTNKIDKITTPVNGNLVTQDATGNLVSHTQSPADLALVGGNIANIFLVADGVSGNDAVNKRQIDSLALDYTLKTDFNAHKDDITTNPHGITPVMIGAATIAHTHTITDITDLQTELSDRYNKVSGVVASNILAVNSSNILYDSGMTAESTLLTGEPA